MWLQIGNIALGLWLLVSPAVLPSTTVAANVCRVLGPAVIWVAVLVLRDVTRPFRALNVLLGMALTVAPWLVPNTPALTASSVLTGWAIIALSIPLGHGHQRTGDGWWAIIRPDPLKGATQK